MDQASVRDLITRKGEAAVLRRVSSARAATGGGITTTHTDLPVKMVKTLDELTVTDGKQVRRIEAMLADEVPDVGDTLVLRGVPYSVSKVARIDRQGLTLLFEVTLV